MKEIHIVKDIDELLNDSAKLESLKEKIVDDDLVVIKNVIDKSLIAELKSYLVNVGRSSFPNYEKIELGAKDFHRINNNDPRAYVKGTFHQFVFYPWNQNYFNLFDQFKKAYRVKNLLSNIGEEEFLDPKEGDDFTARIAFQFYPKGNGFLNEHRDPVDRHQIVVPILIMSEKGDEFNEGGVYFRYEDDEKVYVEDYTQIGDVAFFKASLRHGVEDIDPGTDSNWLDFKGRWMGLLAVNKFFNVTSVANAVDLNSEKK